MPTHGAPTCYIFTHSAAFHARAQLVCGVTRIAPVVYKLSFVAAELLHSLRVCVGLKIAGISDLRRQ